MSDYQSDLKFPLLKYYKGADIPKVLGSGAFGNVYLYFEKTGCELPSFYSKRVAVKVFASEKEAVFYKEVSLFRLIIVSPHPYIVKFLGECNMKNGTDDIVQHCLVMEHYDCDLKNYKQGYLHHFMKKNIEESRKVSV